MTLRVTLKDASLFGGGCCIGWLFAAGWPLGGLVLLSCGLLVLVLEQQP